MLAERGPWTGEIEALDRALDEMAGRSIRPDLAVVWDGGTDPARPLRHILVVGEPGIVVGTLTPSGVSTCWYLPIG